MRTIRRPHLALLLLLAACGSPERDAESANEAAEAAAAGAPAEPLDDEEAAALATEAAEDEAADMKSFGGNAAAGEAGNGS